ncbi:MAG: caspase family protein, partial [Bacteroidota bacterium]
MTSSDNKSPATRSGRDQVPRAELTTTGTSWFLGIGIDAYTEFSPLNNAVRDVEAISELLISDYDLEREHCVLVKNETATRSGILRAMRNLREKVKHADKLIIYYSGHGHLNKYKEGFWIPVSVAPEEEEDFVSNARLRDFIKTIPARHVLVISDACFSGALFVRGAHRAEVAESDLETIPSRWAICSGRHDEQVADGPKGQHSPFAQSILNELKRNKSDVLRVASLADRVVEVTRANYEQLPEGSPLQGVGHQGGQYVFRRRSSEDGFWERCVAQNTSLAYDAYLVQYPNGKYTANAEQALGLLEEEEIWLRTKTTNTLSAYRSFRRRFPSGKFFAAAGMAMQDLRDAATVAALLGGDDEVAIRAFLDNNPDTAAREDLALRLADLTQQREAKERAEALAAQKKEQVKKAEQDEIARQKEAAEKRRLAAAAQAKKEEEAQG